MERDINQRPNIDKSGPAYHMAFKVCRIGETAIGWEQDNVAQNPGVLPLLEITNELPVVWAQDEDGAWTISTENTLGN